MTTRLDTCTSATRPANPVDGQVLFETDTNNMIIADVSDGNWYSYGAEGFFSTGSTGGSAGGGTGGGGASGLSITLNDLTNGEAYTPTELVIIQRACNYIESIITTPMSLEIRLSALGHSSATDNEPSATGGAIGTGGVQNILFNGLTKDSKTYTRPTVGVIHFDPADNDSYLNLLAGQDHFGNVTTNLYWVAIHELLHCLGLGVFWNNPQVAINETGNYSLAELPTPEIIGCNGEGYYTGYYGNLKYAEACGVGGVKIPLERDLKHILHSHKTNAILYSGGNEFGQSIYNYPPFNTTKGVLLRVPKREAFSAAVYEGNNGGFNRRRYVSPIILGMLEDIGYEVNYDNADDYLLTNYVLGSGSPTRNWYGGIPGHDNEFCNGCTDEYPHTSGC